MSKPVNIVLEKYDNEELAEANELIGDLLINANIENKRLKAENAKLRKLVRDMWHEGMCECGSLGKCATCMYEYPTRMCELGIELADA